MSSDNTQRLNSIPFLRFFAFLNIFLFHSCEFEVFPLPYNAAWAVGFFFVLSGFLTGFQHDRYEAVLSISSWKRYIIKKMKKVYPFFLITLIMTLPYNNIFNDLLQFTLDLFLLQSWRPEGYFSYNGVSWFLSSIFFLYVINVPLMALQNSILNKVRKKNLFLLFEIAFFFVIDIFWAYFVHFRDMSLEFYTYILPLSRVPEYICGICLGILIKNKVTSTPQKPSIPYSILELSCFLALFGIFQIDIPEWMHRSFIWIVPNLIFLTVFALQKGYLSYLFSRKFPVLLGNISFECFLLHQVVLHYYCEGVHYLGRRNYFFNDIQKIGSQIFLLILILFLSYVWHSKIAPKINCLLNKKNP